MEKTNEDTSLAPKKQKPPSIKRRKKVQHQENNMEKEDVTEKPNIPPNTEGLIDSNITQQRNNQQQKNII